MRREQDSEIHRAAAIAHPVSWTVVRVTALADYQLEVEFCDGISGRVDLRSLIDGPNAGVFAELGNASVFKSARVEDGVVAWPGGQDLAPDAMYDAIRAHGIWVP